MVGVYDKQNRYRKRKSEQDPEFKKKESRRVNDLIKIKNAAMTDEEKEVQRLQNKQYMRDYRQKKREEKIQIVCATPENAASSCLSPKSTLKRKTGFRTKPALKKAVKKLLREVPTSPSKRKGAVTELAKECGLMLRDPKRTGPATVSLGSLSSKSLSVETISLVTDFYFQTNIVYTSPGLKDEMTVWKDGMKNKLRRYYLELTIKEAHALFKEKHPQVKIGRSKFAELKPVNVLHMNKAPNDQCKCVTHENYRLLLKPLKVEIDKDFWPSVLCNSLDLNSPCWRGNCNGCRGGLLLSNIIAKKQNSDEQQVNWQIWESVETNTKKGKEVKRVVKVLKSGCGGELKELVMNAWGPYLRHVRTKRIMSNEFQDDLSKENVVIFQVDFAMDYNTQHNSREVQSAIYGRQNVTIFTAAIRHQGTWQSYSILTDSDKYKNTVRVCMLIILKHFISITDIKSVDKFIVWSDGPSCEFRNQFCTGKLLYQMSQLMGRISFWKYFAASHGKGVCDGIGGALKARVAEHCRGKHRDNVTVQNYEDFLELAKQLCPKVTLFKLSKEEVQHTTEIEKPWDNTIPIPGISNIHVAKCGLEGTVHTWKLPGEEPLNPISYSIISPSPTVAPPSNAVQSEVIEFVDRRWYVIEFDDGKFKKTMFVN